VRLRTTSRARLPILRHTTISGAATIRGRQCDPWLSLIPSRSNHVKRSLLLLILGVPIPIIILIALFMR
jgi:hypothetical protein